MSRILGLLVVGGVLLAGATVAAAQEGVDGVRFAEPASLQPRERTFEVSAEDEAAPRFSASDIHIGESPAPQRLELELAASGEQSGIPLDVSVAQRASLGANGDGDLDRQGRGSEVRIGRGLVQQEDSGGEGSSVYMFVASDDEALTWRPGQRNEFGGQRSGFSLQDRVEVGDVSAGVTYERGPVQASIAYVEREVSTQVGRDSYSQEENFTGVTVTMRR
jgi:hypothetical protein